MSRLSEQMEKVQNPIALLPRAEVIWFDAGKGYGFLRPLVVCHCPDHDSVEHHGCIQCRENHPDDIYVHFSAIDSDGFKRLMQGQRVAYELHDPHVKGRRPHAAYVRVVPR